MKTTNYEYFVNLHERGQFYADVRDGAGKTILEIRSDDDGRVDLIDDGFMDHAHDLNGLYEYLVQMGLIDSSDTLARGN